MDYYNQKRCVDGKGLVLPSQIVSSALQCVISTKLDYGVFTCTLSYCHMFYFFFPLLSIEVCQVF